MPKTSSSADVIATALNKYRRDEIEDGDGADKFVLVEEVDLSQETSLGHPGGGDSHHNGSKKSKGKRRRVLDPDENVYLVSSSRPDAIGHLQCRTACFVDSSTAYLELAN